MKSSIKAWAFLLLVALMTGCGSSFEWLPNSNLTIAPTANAGTDQASSFNTLVTLDGSGSSASSGQALTYFWAISSKPAGSTAAIVNPTDMNPTFTPDAVGTFTFTLYVNDGKNYSLPSTVRVTSTPYANAGPNQTSVIVNSTVTLDGTLSRAPAGDTLAYHWSFTAFPTANAPILTITNPAKPTFLPTVAGTYTLSLIVNDGAIASPPATVTITVITNTGGLTITW